MPLHKLEAHLRVYFSKLQKGWKQKSRMDRSCLILYICISIFVGFASAVEEHLRTLTNVVYDLVKLYLCSFCLAFPVDVDQEKPENQRDSQDASSITENVHFMLFAVHGITAAWASR